mgnify:CR=1 FL=1
MKKYILLFFLLSLLPCLSTACSDDDGSSTPNLTVGKETVDFNSESGSQNVAVTTNVDIWTVKSDKNWCHPSADGKALKISVDESDERYVRNRYRDSCRPDKDNHSTPVGIRSSHSG